MRIAVMGSGAVGGYFGAKLAAAGHSVAFIARGAHLAAMQTNGLRVDSPSGTVEIRHARFTADAREIGPVDLILVCVKSYDTETASETIRPMVSDHTLILSLQNGIDNPKKLARVFGTNQILPAVVYLGAHLAAPGVINHSAGGRIVFGEIASGSNAHAQTTERVLSAAGILCEVSREIRNVQWTKLLWNAPFCAISCLTHANTKQIIESEALTKLALDCMTEVQAAARTEGIDLPRQLFDDTLKFSQSLGSFKPSMLQDLEANKPLEHEAFNGIVVRLLEAVQKTAPVNQTFYAALSFLDRQNRTHAGA